jgi:hypothetical protein
MLGMPGSVAQLGDMALLLGISTASAQERAVEADRPLATFRPTAVLPLIRIDKPSGRVHSRHKARRSPSSSPICVQIDPNRLHQRGSCLQRSLACWHHKVPFVFTTHGARNWQGCIWT